MKVRHVHGRAEAVLMPFALSTFVTVVLALSVTDTFQLALNAAVALSGVLACHAHDQVCNLQHETGTTGALVLLGPHDRNQPPMPAHQSAWVTLVATWFSVFLPKSLAFAANRLRWSSVNCSLRPPNSPSGLCSLQPGKRSHPLDDDSPRLRLRGSTFATGRSPLSCDHCRCS
ncbi:MAG: hypothetical protein ACI82F_001980 [Planctomycetota bacterium]|jgi:hypothetical protein